MRFSRQTDGQTDKHWTASLHKASTFASTGSVRLYLKDGMFIFCVQVFYELLQLIKADKKRCQNPPESDTKSTAINSTKRSSTTRRNGGVPEGQNSTKRAEKKTNKKCKKRFGRRHDFRRRVRNIRRTVRRAWRRIATCSVMWRHRVTSSRDIVIWRHRTIRLTLRTAKDTSPSVWNIIGWLL